MFMCHIIEPAMNISTDLNSQTLMFFCFFFTTGDVTCRLYKLNKTFRRNKCFHKHVHAYNSLCCSAFTLSSSVLPSLSVHFPLKLPFPTLWVE